MSHLSHYSGLLTGCTISTPVTLQTTLPECAFTSILLMGPLPCLNPSVLSFASSSLLLFQEVFDTEIRLYSQTA